MGTTTPCGGDAKQTKTTTPEQPKKSLLEARGEVQHDTQQGCNGTAEGKCHTFCPPETSHQTRLLHGGGKVSVKAARGGCAVRQAMVNRVLCSVEWRCAMCVICASIYSTTQMVSYTPQTLRQKIAARP